MRNASNQAETERETEALTFGRYQLTRKLSQGGMAEIWLARQSGAADFEKEVVIKIVLPSLAAHDGYEDMLLDEARMAAKLNHPNIVQVLDVGKLDNRFFIAMEFLDGESLLAILMRALEQGKKLPLGFVCRVIADVLAGLEYAHTLSDGDGRGLGIIHRDISPPNVIVSHVGSTKIVDFGIAKMTRRSGTPVTDAGQFKGKVSYMAPEQVNRQPLDARSDIFSTGILLWELLTGKRLFRRADDRETVRALLEDPIPQVSLFTPGCPAAIDQIIQRALQRPVTARFPSARAMRRALEDAIRQHNWPSDPLTMQRVMGELFPARRPVTALPRPVREAPDEDTTTRTRKIAADDTQPDDVIVEISASYATPSERIALAPTMTMKHMPPAPATVRLGGNTLDRLLRVKRLQRIAASALVGLGVCGLTLFAVGRARTPTSGPALPVLPVAAVAAAPIQPAAVTPSAPAPAEVPPPAPARVEVRVDARATVMLDGERIEANRAVELVANDDDSAHELSVQRPGHRARTMTLPAVAPGEKLLVTVWRDLDEGKRVEPPIETARRADEEQ